MGFLYDVKKTIKASKILHKLTITPGLKCLLRFLIHTNDPLWVMESARSKIVVKI